LFERSKKSHNFSSSVVVPDSLIPDPDTDPDAAFGSGSSIQVNLDLDPIQIQGFDDQKLKNKICVAENLYWLFWSKIAIYLSGLHKGSPSYRRSLQPSKRTSSTSKN
jgi:hypothetical protein